jgi:hypothetical protein
MNWYKELIDYPRTILTKNIVVFSCVKNSFNKFSSYDSKDHNVDFAGNDDNDGYHVKIQLTESKNKIVINARFLGDIYAFPLFEETWHYEKDEKKRAIKTFNRIANVLEDMKADLEEDELPGPSIQGKAREELRYIDIDRKKALNNRSLEAARKETGETDWRDSIYSGRYPVQAININNNGTVYFNGSGKQE